MGDGNFILDPPLESERRSLRAALLRRTNSVKNLARRSSALQTQLTTTKKSRGARHPGGCDAGLLREQPEYDAPQAPSNLEARILEDLLSPEPGGLFYAFIHGKHYNDKEIFEIEPNRNSDQVSFRTYDENNFGNWALFNFSGEHKRGSTGRLLRIEHQQLDVTFEKNLALSPEKSTTTDFTGAPQRRSRNTPRPLPPFARAECDRGRTASVLHSGRQE